MRKISLLLVLLTLTWLSSWANAQESPIRFSNKRRFTVPFDPPAQKLRQLQLFVSTDQGQSWQLHATALPEQGRFSFSADRDGFYWFTVRTIDLAGQSFPANLDDAKPSLKVVIDTQPPTVVLQALTPRGNEVGVSWDIQDANTDPLPDAVRLEYRQAGSDIWLPLSPNVTSRQHYWNPQTTGNVQVRLKARDRAGNWGEAGTTVSLGGGGVVSGVGPAPGLVQPPAMDNHSPPMTTYNVPVGGDQERKFVNSKKITLNYSLANVGPSGVSSVELWFTLDGRAWSKYNMKYEDPNQKSVTFDVAGEGVYGISLIARSGVGLGERTPHTGDRPQIWIEVDYTKPVVQFQNIVVGQGSEKGKVTFTWNARDKNLQTEPITLTYAKDKDGPWSPIAEKLPNTGRYVWNYPNDIPWQFYVKIEAIDKARNVGEAIFVDLVKVDTQIPSVNIDGVVPALKGN